MSKSISFILVLLCLSQFIEAAPEVEFPKIYSDKELPDREEVRCKQYKYVGCINELRTFMNNSKSDTKPLNIKSSYKIFHRENPKESKILEFTWKEVEKRVSIDLDSKAFIRDPNLT